MENTVQESTYEAAWPYALIYTILYKELEDWNFGICRGSGTNQSPWILKDETLLLNLEESIVICGFSTVGEGDAPNLCVVQGSTILSFFLR